jgi:secreted trypsin-like serine protease
MKLLACLFALATLLAGRNGANAGGWDREISKAINSAQTGLAINKLPDSLSRVVKDPTIQVALPPERPQSVPIEAFPWVVALITDPTSPQQSYYCAGTIVDANWILTAAACAISSAQTTSERFILVGTSNLSSSRRIVEVERIFLHPSYRPDSHENDLALLKVKTDGIALRLEGPPLASQIGAIAKVVGWGVTNLTNPPAELLQQIPTQVLDPAVCAGPANYADQIKAGNFCARSLLKSYDACSGFAGAPLILNDTSGQQYLAGVVSWGDGCPPKTLKPTVYTNVQAYKEWIASTIRGQ